MEIPEYEYSHSVDRFVFFLSVLIDNQLGPSIFPYFYRCLIAWTNLLLSTNTFITKMFKASIFSIISYIWCHFDIYIKIHTCDAIKVSFH